MPVGPEGPVFPVVPVVPTNGVLSGYVSRAYRPRPTTELIQSRLSPPREMQSRKIASRKIDDLCSDLNRKVVAGYFLLTPNIAESTRAGSKNARWADASFTPKLATSRSPSCARPAQNSMPTLAK